MNKDHFLQQDLHRAQLEGFCIIDCFIRMHYGFRIGDYETAKIAAEDISRSFAELERLSNRKKFDDGLRNLINQIKAHRRVKNGEDTESHFIRSLLEGGYSFISKQREA